MPQPDHDATLLAPAVPLVLCACGAVVLTCTQPECATPHTLHVVAACGRCTATGGMPVLDDETTP